MKADDAKGDFSFTAIKIAKGTNREIPLDIDDCRKYTAKEYAEETIEEMRDPIGFYQRTSKVKIIVDFGNNPGLAPKPRTACLMEYFDKKEDHANKSKRTRGNSCPAGYSLPEPTSLPIMTYIYKVMRHTFHDGQ